MLKPLIATALLVTSGWAFAAEPPLTAARYAQQLGVGLDVDWARTERGIREFDPLVVRDFRAKGISHVRIRVADEPTEARLIHLRKLVEACEQYGMIPIIAYQADAYKNDPKADTEKEVINWWIAVAHYFGQRSPQLGFDLIYEPADKLNHNAASLNRVYEKTIKDIHAIDAHRMIFIAPRLRAAPEDLTSLKLPAHSQNYLLAEWHIFPWGPSKSNGRYPWTSGTVAEKAAIHNRINTALRWQQKTGHVSWVGGWGVGESNRLTPTASQMAFAAFMACELQKAKIPYAINADFQFYDGEEGAWRPAPEPLLQTMIAPACEKPGNHGVRPAARDARHVTPAAASTVKSAAPSASLASPN
ncbi:cellulase family glycosylhydrolase [unidentified bacterial endosymbiont]|uniref:cellulase family glycosylhydrolase n=1 Tax=unidentified bacterial endosymbiont TaxID=2355 RepID=UPI00209F9FF6|nr:cellulase family glycosylhydrolase [unidentified bacterial endosymbiont]